MRHKSVLIRWLAIFIATCTLSLSGLQLAMSIDFGRLQQLLVSRFGADRTPLLRDWQRMLGESLKAPDAEKLRRVNDFINQRITFDDDMSVWGERDYWATPLELLGQGRGDCEDFAIAKYYSLTNLDIPINKLRLVYVKATQTGPAGTFIQAHMVLAYYATPTATPLILDNLNPQILPATRRGDLSPIFSFNSAGLWQGTGNNASTSSLSRWQDLLARARAEGFQ